MNTPPSSRVASFGQTEINWDKVRHNGYSLETMKKDYRLRKQRVHASLWVIQLIEEILSRNRIPVLVGGTNYYKQALMSTLSMGEMI